MIEGDNAEHFNHHNEHMHAFKLPKECYRMTKWNFYNPNLIHEHFMNFIREPRDSLSNLFKRAKECLTD